MRKLNFIFVLEKFLIFILLLVIFIAIASTIAVNSQWNSEIVTFTILAILSAYFLGLIHKKREKKDEE